jgi:outer membrane receptor protein involved in Fe transport
MAARRAVRLIAALLPAPVLAADMGAIVVTGRPPPRPPGAAAFATATIDADRLAASASGRLEDALRDVAGLSTFRRADSRAANPTAQGVTVRGLGGNAASRALVLLDGAPVADPFAQWIPFAALAPERLGLARVTRGGGSGPFGAGALAGVVELESSAPADRPPVSARLLAGARGAVEASAGLTVPAGEGALMLDARHDRGDGRFLVPARQRGPVDTPAAYRQSSVAARLVAPLGETVEAQARFAAFDDRRRRGLPEADVRAAGQDASVRLVAGGPWRIDALAYAQLRDFATVARSPNATRTAATTTLDQFRTPAFGHGGKVEVRPPAAGGHAPRAGVDWRRADGAAWDRASFVAGQPTRLRQAGGRSLTVGLFAEHDWTFEDLTLTGGARADRWTLRDGRLDERAIATGTPILALAFPDRARWETTARAGARLAASPALALRAAVYTGWRPPSLNELYRPFRVGADATAANAALDPERLRGVEAGADWTPLPGWRLGLTAFRNRLGGAIANVTLGEGPGVFPQVGFVAAGGAFRQRLNVDAIVATGAETQASARYGPASLAVTHAWTRSRVRAAGSAATLDGRPPAQTPPHALSATLGLDRAPVSGSLTLRHVAAQAEDDLGARRLPAATTLDLVGRVALGRGVGLIARAENLTGTEVVSGVSAAGVPELAQPRTLWLGVSWAPLG